LPSALFAVRRRRQRAFAVRRQEADGKAAVYRSLLCRSLLPSAADGKGLCRPPFEPLPSAMADGKVAVSCSVSYCNLYDQFSAHFNPVNLNLQPAERMQSNIERRQQNKNR